MLNKEQKKQIIEELVDKIKRQQSLVFTDVSGVGVSDLQDLRRKLREIGAEYKMAKKTLTKLALEGEKKDLDISTMNGSIGMTFSYSDPIASIKVLDKFSKQNENLKILGGLVEDKVLSLEQIKELAKIPSKEELLAILVSSLKSPMSGFVNVLCGNIRNLVGVLNAIVNK